MGEQIILGIIQGIAEWLPISSSGHLALASLLFGFDQPLALDIFLHVGSLMVIVVYFKTDIIELFNGFFKKTGIKERRMVAFLGISTIITIVIALLIEPIALSLREQYLGLAGAFLITTLLVGLSVRGRGDKSLSIKFAVILGLVQGLAVVPGISRSGAMIGTALLLGIDKKTAFRYAFLAGIPVIAGAFVYTLRDATFNPQYLLGFIVVVIVGYASLWLMERVVKKGKLHYFALYTLIISLILLLYAR